MVGKEVVGWRQKRGWRGDYVQRRKVLLKPRGIISVAGQAEVYTVDSLHFAPPIFLHSNKTFSAASEPFPVGGATNLGDGSSKTPKETLSSSSAGWSQDPPSPLRPKLSKAPSYSSSSSLRRPLGRGGEEERKSLVIVKGGITGRKWSNGGEHMGMTWRGNEKIN